MIVILIVYIIRVRIYKSHFFGIGHITKEFPFLSVIKKIDFFDRNASTKQSFHIDRRGMNFVNRFLANSSSYWSWLVPACWEFSFLSEPDPFLDRLLKHLLIPHVLAEPPHSFNHLLVIAAIPRKGRGEGIVRSRSCDEPNIVRSRILRTTGSRPRSPLRRTIYRSEELTFSCKSSILLLSKVMLGCFTQVRFARPHDEHVLS